MFLMTSYFWLVLSFSVALVARMLVSAAKQEFFFVILFFCILKFSVFHSLARACLKKNKYVQCGHPTIPMVLYFCAFT